MSCWRRLALGAARLLLMGCTQNAREERAGSGSSEAWEVKWPGGSVKIDPKRGVDVKAPGVHVNVDKDRGVKVKAPHTNVKVDKDQGVQVQAPGTDVQVK